MCASETAEQVVVAQWLAARPYILSTHPASGGFRFKSTARLMQRLGAVAGVPDLLIFSPPPLMPGKVGVAIEMKRTVKPAWLTPQQKEWLRRLDECGWVAQVCRGASVAIDLLTRLGYDQAAEVPCTRPEPLSEAMLPLPRAMQTTSVAPEILAQIACSPL